MADKTRLGSIIDQVVNLNLRQATDDGQGLSEDIISDGLAVETKSASPVCTYSSLFQHVYATPEQVKVMESMASRPAKKTTSPAWCGLGTYLDQISAYNSTKSSSGYGELPSTSKRPTSMVVTRPSPIVTRSSTTQAASTSHLHSSTSFSGPMSTTSSLRSRLQAENEKIKPAKGRTAQKRRRGRNTEYVTIAKKKQRYQRRHAAEVKRMNEDPIYAGHKRAKWRAATKKYNEKKRSTK